MPASAIPDPGGPDIAGGFFAATLAGGLGLAVLFEVLEHVTWNALPLVFIIPSVLLTPALIAATAARRWRRAVAVWAAAAVVVVVVYVAPCHPRKRFVWDLYSLRPGMTVSEVEAVMGRYIKGAGRKWGGDGAAAYPEARAAATATGAMVYRWTDAGYDSDWGEVEFAAGRVVGVRFLPD